LFDGIAVQNIEIYVFFEKTHSMDLPDYETVNSQDENPACCPGFY